jgi:hypothetical protein
MRGSRAPVPLSMTLALLAGVAALAGSSAGSAQPARAAPAAERAARESAPIDMTGTWVSIVNEDWRWRMVTPPKGDTTSVQPLNAQGRAAAEAWDPAQDGSCKAYGAPALLRMPTRLRVSWETADIMKLETDAGRQTRRLVFNERAAGEGDTAASPSLQGVSRAEWQRTLPRVAALGAGPPAGAAPPGGSLKVVTTDLAPGWLRRNGVPYSERTTLTEYFDRFAAPNGAEWLVVTTIVEDPTYLTGRFITSSHFRREANDSKWSSKPCRSEP